MFSVLSGQFYFPRLLLLFYIISCHHSHLAFALIDGISGCLWFLSTRLYFKDVSCTFQGRFFVLPRPCSQAHSSKACRQFLCQYFFSWHFLLFRNFHLLTKLPLWLLASLFCFCFCTSMLCKY